MSPERDPREFILPMRRAEGVKGSFDKILLVVDCSEPLVTRNEVPRGGRFLVAERSKSRVRVLLTKEP